MTTMQNFKQVKIQVGKKRRQRKLRITFLKGVISVMLLSVGLSLISKIVYANEEIHEEAEKVKKDNVGVVAEAQESRVKNRLKETAETEEAEEIQSEFEDQAYETENAMEASLSNAFIYVSEIPLPKEHQEYLYKLCNERGLDYRVALAVMQTESFYTEDVISDTNDYGYFQINATNHENLSEILNTPNAPLDSYVNMNWGTHMLSYLYEYWSDQGVSGDALDTYVWSSYNKGITGFKKTGVAVSYVNKIRDAKSEIDMYF